MTTVTITIDDPNGLDSNLMFPSTAPFTTIGAGFNNTAGTAFLDFRRVVNGVAVDPRYRLGFTGDDFAFGFVDVYGDIASMKLNIVNPDLTLGAQLMHADFALDGDWAAFGGVRIASADGLTVDVLMGRIMQRTAANLVIIGNVGNDTLNGSFLDDVLRGNDGGDRLIGGLGSDTASYEFSSAAVVINLATGAASGGHATGDTFSSIENVIGTNFNDNITGNSLANFIDGALGFDTIDGGAGDDFIFGRDGGGVLRGGAGNDRVDGGIQNDIIYGGIGNDELRVGDGTNTAYGEDGNDNLLGASGIDRLYGAAGTDTLDGDTGADILDGGLGADTMFHFSGAAIFYVDNAGDIARDFVTGDGDRVITSVSYALPVGSGIELLLTSNASGTGNINLTGNDAAQSIYGNNGVNFIDGKGGADTMVGYGSNDRYYADNAADRAIEAAGGGADDRVYASVSYTLTANSQIEFLATNNSALTAAIDLTGNTLAQTIYGNAGNNVINGKAGLDILRGLGGLDTFAFDTALGAANVDRILDFIVADDTIRLENGIFLGLAAGVLAAGAFRAGAGAADADDRIIFNSATGALFFDRDGLGGVAQVQFATLATGLPMTNADFAVV